MLACTPMSPPSPSFSPRANAIGSPSTAEAFAQPPSSGDEVTMCFSTPLMNVANGSIVLVGQNRDHSS